MLDTQSFAPFNHKWPATPPDWFGWEFQIGPSRLPVKRGGRTPFYPFDNMIVMISHNVFHVFSSIWELLMLKWEYSPTSPRPGERHFRTSCSRAQKFTVHWHCMPASFKGKPHEEMGQIMVWWGLPEICIKLVPLVSLLIVVLNTMLKIVAETWSPYNLENQSEIQSQYWNDVVKSHQPCIKTTIKTILKTTEPAKFQCPMFNGRPVFISLVFLPCGSCDSGNRYYSNYSHKRKCPLPVPVVA